MSCISIWNLPREHKRREKTSRHACLPIVDYLSYLRSHCGLILSYSNSLTICVPDCRQTHSVSLRDSSIYIYMSYVLTVVLYSTAYTAPRAFFFCSPQVDIKGTINSVAHCNMSCRCRAFSPVYDVVEVVRTYMRAAAPQRAGAACASVAPAEPRARHA